MAVSYRSLGGRRRAWTVDTWAEWQAIAPANFSDGDTLYYTAGKVSLTRRDSRWRPDEEHLWGRNDATVAPTSNGSIDSEGVWTCSTNPGGSLPAPNSWFDVLAIVLPDRASFAMTVASPTGAPSFVGIRAVVMTSANASMAVTMRQDDSIYGGASVSYGATAGNDVIYYGQGIVVPGGAGGLGDDTVAGSGGESLWRPAETDYNLTPYDISDATEGPITVWGGTEHDSRST